MSQTSNKKTVTSNTPKDLITDINANHHKYILRVGQFNVLNLVKENVNFYGKSHYSADEVTLKVNWIADQLKRMNSGIVGFEEVFDHATLLRATKASGLYQDSNVISANANGHGPTVAIASIFPILSTKVIQDFPTSAIMEYNNVQIPIVKFSRPILRAEVQLPFGRTVVVYVVHAKSKRPIVSDQSRHDQKAKAVGHGLSLLVRAAESVALRHIIVDELENNPLQPVILIGDLNDEAHAVTTEIITGTQPWKSLPQKVKNSIWNTLLWPTTEIQQRSMNKDVLYSHIHNGRYDVLDHVMVSQHFVRSNPNHHSYVQYVQMFNDHVLDETLTEEKRTEIESDHGQAVTVIKMLSDTELSSIRGNKRSRV